MPTPRSKNRRGATMVEAALTLSLLLFVVIGIVDIGTVLFTYQGLVQRAQAGVRYAVVNTYNAEKIRNVVASGSPDGGGSILGLDPEMVEVVIEDIDNQTTRIVVAIGNYPIRLFTPFVASSFNLPPIVAVRTTESQGATT